MSQLWLSVKAERAARAAAHAARVMAAARRDLQMMRLPRYKSEIALDAWLDKVEKNVGQFIDRAWRVKHEEAIE